jgi:hypothetical protein
MSMQELEVGAAERAVGRREPQPPGAESLQSGLGAWASAISADDNAQAAIALAEAINRARGSQTTRDNRAADARIVATGRLETLRARLAPIYAAIPRDVELFDLGVVGHAPPRLFVDIIAFIEMAADGRSFRLIQETRAGRILLGESADEKQMATLVTNYIAERLVERERALAAVGAQMKPLPKAQPAASPPAPPPPAPDDARPAAVASAPVLPAQRANPAQLPGPAMAAATVAAATTATATTAAANARRSTSGGWFWPLLALAIGIGLGALALYLYALSLNRV